MTTITSTTTQRAHTFNQLYHYYQQDVKYMTPFTFVEYAVWERRYLRDWQSQYNAMKLLREGELYEDAD